MIGFVIWIIGLILTFRAAIEIWNINAAVEIGRASCRERV